MFDISSKNFERYNREIEALYYVLIGFLVILMSRICYVLFIGQFNELWPLLPPAITLISAMIITRSANRLIENGKNVREAEQRQEILKMSHHLIATTKDLKQRIGYAKKLITEGDRPAFVLGQIATSIEKRYESLYEPDLYKYLPGDCIDLVVEMSGSVYGLVTLAAGITTATADNPMVLLNKLPNKTTAPPIEPINNLEDDVTKLIDKLFALRKSLDQS